MAKYDVYKLGYGVIVPLLPLDYVQEKLPRLTPVVQLGEDSFLFMPANITAIPAPELKEKVGTLEQYHHEITDALDFLFQGF